MHQWGICGGDHGTKAEHTTLCGAIEAVYHSQRCLEDNQVTESGNGARVHPIGHDRQHVVPRGKVQQSHEIFSFRGGYVLYLVPPLRRPIRRRHHADEALIENARCCCMC